MRPARLRLALAAAAALPLVLGGCVAAAVPIAAGVLAASKGGRKGPATRAAAPPEASAATPFSAVVMTGMTELPPPSADPDGYAAFTAFTRDKAAARKPEGGGSSMVLAGDSQLPTPRFVPCGALPPAVIVDLDPGTSTFDPAAPGITQPGLAAQLASLRAAGVTVMWASLLPVDEAQAAYDRLRVSGLDPTGIDRVMLMRPGDERKQTRRLAAAGDWCVIAMVGDRDGDFDELFDYLRDPDYAAPLGFLKNAGWFIAPPPITPTETPRL